MFSFALGLGFQQTLKKTSNDDFLGKTAFTCLIDLWCASLWSDNFMKVFWKCTLCFDHWPW